jgi:hypothetical protein
MIKFHYVTKVGLALLLLVGLSLGCSKNIPPPVPLPVGEFATTFEKAFTGAKGEAKELATQIVAAVEAKDYSKAFMQLQTLFSAPGLTKEQQGLLTRASMTLNEVLASAQSQGDQKAAQTIQYYNKTK